VTTRVTERGPLRPASSKEPTMGKEQKSTKEKRKPKKEKPKDAKK
jgi:hypothetical protein